MLIQSCELLSAGPAFYQNQTQNWDISVTERWYRLIQGIYLLAALYAESQLMILVLIALLSLEALSNIQLPTIVSRFRYSNNAEMHDNLTTWAPFKLNSERLLRIVVLFLLVFGCLFFPDTIWFLPWFVAAMLLLAGITNICPMVMMFRFIGFE